MGKAHLIMSPYDDNDAEDLCLEELNNAQRTTGTREKLKFWRMIFDVLVLLCLGVSIILIICQDSLTSERSCTQHHLPVGSDLSGFVPPDISSRPTLWASGPDVYTVSAQAFENLAILNETIKSWAPIANGFVLASPYDGRGPQIPFESSKGHLFVISAFHQIHCLTSILQDFGMLQAGFSRDQLIAAYDGKVLTWAEHKAHCFNYVRQAIMCHADSTAEGHIDGNVHRVADNGVLHICNDFNALVEWAAQPERILPEGIKTHDRS